ncbi:MAP3K12-binding inhibitory protein 1 [Parasteatoda tepidariorum]|uniref:MAP3K12-binding inhibitory protein 1 n=1 Tax=Parasteatoda tepidariorum TaxID=114398 RepID=UPI001C7190C5|nr:MAP3K12-binding inhibitory protein 1 [Parasteatoda tepidariorum]
MEPDTIKESATKLKDLIQIQVDDDEIEKRISTFIERKRKEANELNVQEFCGHQLISEDDPAYNVIESCARVDAVVIPRLGSKSRIKISRVENRYGPQTKSAHKKIKVEPGLPTAQNSITDSLEERLRNMESHLKMEDCSGKTAFQRIKALEDKILYLEGMSPEYFNLSGASYTSPKKKMDQEIEKLYSNWSVDDIQKRIQALKETLKSKSKSAS